MKRTLLNLLIVLLILVTAGCARFPGRKGPELSGPTAVPSHPLISQQELTQKIVSLQQKLQENRISETDRPGAEALLEIYKLMENAFFPPTGETGCRQLIARIFLRLDRIEATFQPAGKAISPAERTAMDFFARQRKRILESYLSGDFRDVINRVFTLKEQLGASAITPDIKLILALSFANQGLFKEAIQTGEYAARELEQIPDLIILEAKIATWYSRLGKEDAAMLHYEKVNDLMDDRTALLNNLKQELQARPKKQDGKHLSLPEVLGMVENQLQAHAFDHARMLLLQKRQDGALSPSELATIDQALERVEKAKEASLGREKRALKEIRHLMEEENYEAALNMLEGLRSEGIQGDEITRLEHEAREKFISRERKKAAALFLRARAAASSLEKKEYLRRSHDILQHLLDKFPSSPSRDKILQNLESVDRELAK
jgi:tetratricopeptide (TPR) repeat protein